MQSDRGTLSHAVSAIAAHRRRCKTLRGRCQRRRERSRPSPAEDAKRVTAREEARVLKKVPRPVKGRLSLPLSLSVPDTEVHFY